MLNKQLCKIFNIDEFTQWIMKELDDVEDKLYDSPTAGNRIDLAARYSTLQRLRDVYCFFKRSEANDGASGISTYKFSITLTDFDDDPSRFEVLTHHFDYICSELDYSDVAIYSVNVLCDTYSHGMSNIHITGYADSEDASGESLNQLFSSIDLTDWGNVYLTGIEFAKIEDKGKFIGRSFKILS